MGDIPPKIRGAHVQSVEKALIILETLFEENREMSLTELAKALDWPKSTVHGLLSTLREYQFVDQSHVSGHYGLGIRLFELGSQVARNWNIRQIARPVMLRLNDFYGETVQLATEENGEVLYIDKLESNRMMRIVSEIGARLPMHCSGLGKVLLAHKTEAEARGIIKKRGMRAMTAHTIVTPEALEAELSRIRAQRYAIDDRETMDGLRCVAAPIHDREGQVRYAISISGLAGALRGERFEEILRAVREAAEEISHAMGYRALTNH